MPWSKESGQPCTDRPTTVAEVELGPESLIIGNDPAFVEVYNAVARVAPLPIPVLVRGETGTGKELIARALHQFGAHPDQPFVPLNCGAIPENLLESELFGHRKGSFTGADRDHRGAIEAARDGTLFLDEVGELPAALQVKLLRFLQSGEVRAVGADHTRRGAGPGRRRHQPRPPGGGRGRRVSRGLLSIASPPTRSCCRRCETADPTSPCSSSTSAAATRKGLVSLILSLPALRSSMPSMGHPWPGNVRELEHVVQRAIVDSGSLSDEQMIRSLLAANSSNRQDIPPEPGIGDDLTLTDLERRHIEAVLRRCEGNRTRAAEILGIERKSLYRKAERLGIALDPEEVES